jgi:polysaccharide biosynthesis/export protein
MTNARTTAHLAALIFVFAAATSPLAGQNQTPSTGRGSQPTGRGSQPAAPTQPAGRGAPPSTVPPVTAQGVVPPPGYVIGAEDVLTVVFWREPDISGDVTVRPDGNISLPLINDIPAAGTTPEQLRTKILEGASRYLTDPNVTVVVKQINSRKVFITGMVNKIGAYPLVADMRVLQLISIAGGLQDYAKEEQISVVRSEKGRQVSYRFNYKEVSKGRRLEQNILLQPGDTVVVP